MFGIEKYIYGKMDFGIYFFKFLVFVLFFLEMYKIYFYEIF